MNELAWVDFLKKHTPKTKRVIAGIGEDCAVIANGKEYFLLSSDLFIENVHFKLGEISLRNLGKRAVARAFSDIIACAGIPEFLGISIGIPPYITSRNLKSIYAGIKEYCRGIKVSFVGGDTARTKSLFMDVWVVGKTKKYVLRSTARAGDYVFVTGVLGKLKFNQAFKLRVKEIQTLVSNFKLNAMIDISDGFILDLWRILKASKKGALIRAEDIPINASFNDIFRGEDYELIFTVSKDQDINCLKRKYFLVGEIKERDFGYKIESNNKIKKIKVKGFTHF